MHITLDKDGLDSAFELTLRSRLDAWLKSRQIVHVLFNSPETNLARPFIL